MDETKEDVEDDAAALEEAEEPKLNLSVKVDTPSPCERHVTVTIPREDIERYFDNVYSDLMPTAAVPGFRPGRAPRKLVEQRFRKEVVDQVKGSLLMDSISQASEDEKLTAISEPEFDFTAVEVPEEGDMTYEFDIEVRPEFDLPQWRGLTIERPQQEVSDQEIDERLLSVQKRYGALKPIEGKAELGDYLSVNIHTHHDGKHLVTEKEVQLCIRPKISFHDAELAGFDKLVVGVQADDKREAEVDISRDAANEELAGKRVQVEFEVLDVKRLELRELTPEFLQEMGEFDSVDALRTAIRDDLKERTTYQQQRRAREQVSAALVESANWELPPRLLKRQSAREIERALLELRRNRFSEEEIRAMENELRRNSAASTAKALKEHFILERIAEEEGVDADEPDYDDEIRLIAKQSGDSPRRVRAQLEKRELMDTLRNQIVERKVIELVLSAAKFKDIPAAKPRSESETYAADVALAGGGDLEGLNAAETAAAAAAGPAGAAKPANPGTQVRPQ